MQEHSENPRELCLSGQRLRIDEVFRASRGDFRIEVTRDAEVIDRMRRAEELVGSAVESGLRVYGVTTGFGSMADIPVPGDQAEASQANLLAFLASGTGPMVEERHVRAAMVLRANMLLRGASGVRREIPDRLVRFLNAGVTPVVYELGSIGASGDLVPLAAIARAITGHESCSRIRRDGEEQDAREVLRALGLNPLQLKPKEGLAIINGTSFSAGIAANCLYPARRFIVLTLAMQAMMIRALLGHEEPFSSFVHECKPHPGQIWVAAMMRDLLGAPVDSTAEERAHIQDSYSLRCLPQYAGPIVEGILRVESVVETEMNAVTDNPLIDVENACFYQGGNFLGQYVGMAMDDLRRYLGLMAKHLDVMIAQLVSPEFSRGLPASLHGNGELSFNMGLKGLQITGNSIMPVLMHLGNSLVDHYPTHAEQFNQNINGLSWGSALLASQSVDLFSHYAAVGLIFSVQAVDLRARESLGHCDGRGLLGEKTAPLYEAVYHTLGRKPGEARPLVYNDADRTLEEDLRSLGDSIREGGTVARAIEPLTSGLDSLKA